jgi:methylenetetrahydrofolate reductase (NADPH)
MSPSPTATAMPSILPMPEEASRITEFMRRCSMEATRPSRADAQLLREALPAGTEIFLSAVPKRPRDEVVLAARAIRMAGLEPVPHIAARGFTDAAAAGELLARLRAEAEVKAVLLIGGDIAEPAGEISEASQLIASGVLRQAGIERVGIAGHPEGHPFMSDEALESALVTKIAAAQREGHEVEIVTQFGSEPQSIIRWIEWLRKRGVNLPVRIGLAGPTTLMSWLSYARRCGVRASAEGLVRRSGLARHVFHTVAPDTIIRALAQASQDGRLGEISPHLFSFGGTASTARWAAGAMRGAITLDKEGGFHVEPLASGGTPKAV